MSGIAAALWSSSRRDRQRPVINRLLEGFEGKLTTSKWAALTKSSQDTALRDIQQLVEPGILVRKSGGWTQHELFARVHLAGF